MAPKDSAPTRSRRRPRHRSLFFKLFMVLLGGVLLTYLAFGGYYRSFWNTNASPGALPNAVYYWGLVSREIGNPPDTAFAAQISERLQVAIAIRGPGLDWRSGDFPGRIARRLARSDDSIPRLLDQGRIWAGIRRDGNLYMFGSRRKQVVEGLNSDWMALIPVLGLCWLLGWLVLRHLLRPLRDLEDGVEAVSGGNLDVRLTEGGRDELGGLAQSFNLMTQRLKERDRARDQLLLDVSHELRSPLTRMRVALEMAEPSAAVDSLRDEVEALGKMVTEILETERLNSLAGGLKLVPGDLNTLLREKIARFEGQEPGIRFTKAFLPPVPMDLERMRLLLRNLLENALKHGKYADEPVEVALRLEGDFAVVEVSNGGAGVPEEEQRLIFEPFYRTDRSRSGTPGYGLGLPLCKRIVEAHGGTIEFRSRPGEKTTVTVRLPLG